LNNQLNIIAQFEMSKTSFWAAIMAAALIYLLFLGITVRVAGGKKNHNSEKGWHVPSVDANANGNSIFHQFDIRFKIAAISFYCLATALLNRLEPALTALIGAFVCLYLAKISLKRAKRRLSAIAGFLSMFLFIMPLTAANLPGDPVLILAPYHLIFNLRAFQQAIIIIIKASAIALMMEPLFGTAPLSVTIDGMRRLGLPKVICQMLLLSHRYIFVFIHEVKRMSTSMRLRGFRKKTNITTMQVMGNFVGMLLIRSVDRTERVYQAMLARGFNGSFPVYYECKTTWQDWLKLSCLVIFALLFLGLERM